MGRPSLSVFLCVLIVLVLLQTRIQSGQATGEGWLSGWSWRKSHTITQKVGAGVCYDVNLTIYAGAGSDSGTSMYLGSKGGFADFRDLRFTSGDGSTLLWAWNESTTTGSSVFLWVNLDQSLNLDSGDQTIWVYYGNSGASENWDIERAFPGTADDFNDNSFNSSKWNNLLTRTPTESGGQLHLAGATNGAVRVNATLTFSTDMAFRAMASLTDTSTVDDVGLGFGAYAQTDSKGAGFSTYDPGRYLVRDTGWSLPAWSEIKTANTIYDVYRNGSNSGRSVRFYCNGAEQGNSPYTTQIPTANCTIGFWTQALANSKVDVNWVFVRKYINGDVSHGAWGSEQGSISYLASSLGNTSNETISTSVFYCYWFTVTTTNLSGFIFCWNVSGSLVNDTWTAFASWNDSWSNTTKIISYSIGTTIEWLLYANASDAGWFSTLTKYSLVYAAITFQFHTGGSIEGNGTSISNLTKTNYFSPTNLTMSALPLYNYSLTSWSTSYSNSTDNPFLFVLVNSTTLMCVFQNITGWAPVVSYAIARFDFLPSDPFVNEVVTFDASQSYNTTQISLFGWTWDDGQSNTTTAFSITHSYGSAGLYTVTLNVTDAGATLSSFIFHSVNVSAVPAAYSYAVARFDFNPSNPTPGQHVVFNASQSYNTTDVAFNWDFGDGNITLVSDSFLVVHSFASNITYLVSLELHGTLTTVNSTMFFRSVNVTTASVGGGLSRTEPEDLASLVIAGFIGVVLLIGVIVIVTRGRRR